MKQIIIALSIILTFAVSGFAAQSDMSSLKARCNRPKSTHASAAGCYDLGNVFKRKKNTTLALYYWRKSLQIYTKIKEDKEIKIAEDTIFRLFDQTALGMGTKQQMCLVVQMLPWTIKSNVLASKTNTIDQNIEAQMGSYKSILDNSAIGLGLQVDYSLQTFINSIGSIYNNGNIAHAITWLYLLGQAMEPDNPVQGMVTAFNDSAQWTFSQDLFGNRNAMAQYGAALQVIDLIRKNKIKNPLLKNIIAKLMMGDPGAAATLLLSDKSTMIAAVNAYKKIRINNCGLPAELL